MESTLVCQALTMALLHLGYDKHFRVHHGANEFVRGESHTNGIESFGVMRKDA